MRITLNLCAQHLGWTFKKHWQVQGKKVIRETGAVSELARLGINVKDPKEILIEKPNFERIQFIDESVNENENSANCSHNELCHVYGDENVVLSIEQAQVLTNTLVFNNFPKKIEEAINRVQLSSATERRIRNLILSSHLLDSEQVKLAKVKLLERPAYNLPRVYGISLPRKNRLLVNNLISECEKISGKSVNTQRRLVDNVPFNVFLQKDEDFVQFSINVEKMITSLRPIEPVDGKFEATLPDIYPMSSTITIPKVNSYRKQTLFPFYKQPKLNFAHTILLEFNNEIVKNLHGSKVTINQMESRNMLKAFAVAAAQAKCLHGENLNANLPKPIVVQSIQTDGTLFHFGIFQLNTLSLDNENQIKNYWFNQATTKLFESCEYKSGKPSVDGVNLNVFRVLNAFYNA